MKSFYDWLMEDLQKVSEKGQLAKFIYSHAKKLPALKDIDSFRGLVDILDPHVPARFCGDLSIGTMHLVKESIWNDYCRETGHPLDVRVFDNL